jgi:hypothetical protein
VLKALSEKLNMPIRYDPKISKSKYYAFNWKKFNETATSEGVSLERLVESNEVGAFMRNPHLERQINQINLTRVRRNLVRSAFKVGAGLGAGFAGDYAGRSVAENLGYRPRIANGVGGFIGGEAASAAFFGFGGPGVAVGAAASVALDVAGENYGWHGSDTFEVLRNTEFIEGLRTFEVSDQLSTGASWQARKPTWAEYFYSWLPGLN